MLQYYFNPLNKNNQVLSFIFTYQLKLMFFVWFIIELVSDMAGVLRSKDNPVVFFDLHANKQKIGRVTFELFADICPKTAQNYRQFCTGEFLHKQIPTGYKDTCLHRIIQDKFIEGGDFVTNGINSKPKFSIWGENVLFQDQNYLLNHNEAGLLSMVNLGMKSGNGNIFRITAGPCPELDGKNTVFGKAIDESSQKVIKIVSGLELGSEFRPKYPVVIRECGEM